MEIRLRTKSQSTFMIKLFLEPEVTISELRVYLPEWEKCNTIIEAGQYIENFLIFLKTRREYLNGKRR